MNVFADAAAQINNNRDVGEAGIYVAGPASPSVPVRVIRARHDPVVSFPGLETAARSPGWEVWLLQADVPTRPVPNVSTIMLGATTYTILDVQEDVERTAWQCDAS